MKTTIRNLIYISILSIFAFASTSFAEGQRRQPSAVHVWQQELEMFKKQKFSNLVEMKKTATEFQNKLMDDESIRFEDKRALRNQMYEIENQKSADFPAPQIVGFKKVPVDPSNPGLGYVLEPEFK